MKVTPHQKKIIEAIPEAQRRLGVEWVTAGFLHPHMGRLPQPASVDKLLREGVLVRNPENRHEFKLA